MGVYLPKAEAFLAKKQAVQQKEMGSIVTLTVSECSEFHNLGEYHENIESIDKAISIFNKIPVGRMNGIPSIGINIHIAGTKTYEDISTDILCGRTVDLGILEYMPEITANHNAIAAIEDMIARLPDVEVIGSLDKWKR